MSEPFWSIRKIRVVLSDTTFITIKNNSTFHQETLDIHTYIILERAIEKRCKSLIALEMKNV